MVSNFRTGAVKDPGCVNCEQGKSILARRNQAKKSLENAMTLKTVTKKEKRGQKKAPAAAATKTRTIELDFENHPELFQQLVDSASADLRPVEYQALYLIRQAVA